MQGVDTRPARDESVKNVRKGIFRGLRNREHKIVDCTKHFGGGSGGGGDSGKEGYGRLDSKLIDPTASGGALATRNCIKEQYYEGQTMAQMPIQAESGAEHKDNLI
ncbi:hypothetical protein EPUS_06062 [Endocarpon pusillum Z07020]|uniref:Uncharacterized protein n=1 Tax=Endocarpon pusillum (strain Z07020 / HMAS-L-300199) TaxID=1263415 RepID=U1GJU0_ENDPU|nr:uncharacterized protein EPUS_06062 [Endocarpon pusillum Z07020]ERF72433.1 hypothetical protein EPUS_06062 [Endocarpon pusillum Z07020]